MRRERVDGSAQTSQPVNSHTPDPSAIPYPPRQLLRPHGRHFRPVLRSYCQSFAKTSQAQLPIQHSGARQKFRAQNENAALLFKSTVQEAEDSVGHPSIGIIGISSGSSRSWITATVIAGLCLLRQPRYVTAAKSFISPAKLPSSSWFRLRGM